MAGVLEALVARAQLDSELAAIEMSPGWWILPTTHQPGQPRVGDPGLQSFLSLTAPTLRRIESVSRQSAVAYVHLEYHGGTGFQAAAVWDAGSLVFGPVFTANHPSELVTAEYELVAERSRIGEQAINRALRHLGAVASDGFDEFATVGLDRHRRNDDWLADRS